MKILRQSLAFSLTLVLALPGWAAGDVVGVAVQSQAASVHQAKLAAGSTVYSGDSITAGPNGRAQVSLPGGGRVDVLSNSTVRVDRNSGGVQMTLEEGSATFQSRPDSPVSAVFPDALVRAPKGGTALAIIGMENPNSALIVAKIGSLEVISEHDSHAVLVPEGSAARITLLPDEPPQGPAGVPAAGRSHRRMAAILLLAGGGVTAGAILAATAGSSNSNPVSPSAP